LANGDVGQVAGIGLAGIGRLMVPFWDVLLRPLNLTERTKLLALIAMTTAEVSTSANV
jgi:hypothetical protein